MAPLMIAPDLSRRQDVRLRMSAMSEASCSDLALRSVTRLIAIPSEPVSRVSSA